MIDLKPELSRGMANRVPANFRVRAERLTFDEGDAAVAKLSEVLERQQSGTAMIEHNIGYTRNPAMS